MFEELNPQQFEAVRATEGPVLIVAGPGSGKTKVLTHRIVYLIKAKEIDARNILAVTFTNKAAGEMKERVIKLLRDREIEKQTAPTIGTFHAICAKILHYQINRLGYSQNFIIYDENDQKKLIKRIMKNLKIDIDQFNPYRVLNTISRAKEELIDQNSYQNQAYGLFQEVVARTYKNYQKALKLSNALDFDDLIMKTVEIFKKYPKVLEDYQNKFQYLLVDEYQDTNTSQYTLTNLLAQIHNNIFAIGDMDQSVYTWRGADFRNILNFERDYPRAKIIVLENCYRCSQNILKSARSIISKNTQRREKKLKSTKKGGAPIIIYKADDEKGEAEFIAKRIKDLTYQEELKLNDFVVLYRTNAQSRALEEGFLSYGIPYKVIGGIKFYGRREIKDILAYLKLIQNPKDSISRTRIINIPPGKINKKIEKFDSLISHFRKIAQKSSVSELIKGVLKKIEYEDYIKKDPQGQSRWENILELLTVAKKYDYLSPPKGLERFLEEVTLLTDADNVERNKEIVNLMTLHCAKGLEFKVVFIAGCEHGLLPHSLSQTEAELEEERRLIYVGITRAKQRVYLTFTNERNLYGSTTKVIPSEFLKDIPKKLVQYEQCSWQEIKDKVYE